MLAPWGWGFVAAAPAPRHVASSSGPRAVPKNACALEKNSLRLLGDLQVSCALLPALVVGSLSFAQARSPRSERRDRRRRWPLSTRKSGPAVATAVATLDDEEVTAGDEATAALSVVLSRACREGQAQVALRLLMDKPGDTRKALAREPGPHELSALVWAVHRNLEDVVQLMLRQFVEELRHAARGALFQASRLRHERMTKLLIEAFPDEARACAGRDLSEAARSGNIQVIQLLLQAFPDEASQAVPQALNEACSHGSARIARYLLDTFPDESRRAFSLSSQQRPGQTPMHGVCRSGISGVARVLFDMFPEEAQIALTQQDHMGKTPVAWACDNGHDDIVAMVLARFPDLNAQASSPVQSAGAAAEADLPEMLEDRNRENLAHAGYRLVGSHSAVKQCRWTKNALRGEGQCYKHAFYGINSHQCMEATPSLACANKCTFCWRNHQNPVATDWTFQTDDPEWIVQESIRNHHDLIDEAARSPLTVPERAIEARTVRHTALSLVGEPVLYPHRKEFIAALHRQRISTFLVTNGQFPEQLRDLPWVTQLYVSVDAPDEEELRKVGRPLFKDYWRRLREALTILREKKPQQRTVCRLTVLKGQNMGDIACQGYGDLIGLSECDFVEIKGATFAPVWEKKSAGLSPASMPSHVEVKSFAERLAEQLPGYALACEHEHSCAVLLARRDRYFTPEGRWCTWIDYERFADAAAAGRPLNVTEFAQETPQWALADGWRSTGVEHVGSDPQERRRPSKRTSSKELPKHTMMADVAVLPDGALHPQSSAEALMRAQLTPRVRSVAIFEPVGTGKHSDRASIRPVAGDPDLKIIYKEWGLQFHLDLSRRLSRLSHSQGSVEERRRICNLVKLDERVLVLGSGVGQTACIIGAHSDAAEVVGVERNDVANEFANVNIQANRLSGKVRSILGDPLVDIESLGTFDRVCAFLPWKVDGQVLQLEQTFAKLVSAVAPGGTLHFYSHETEEEFKREPADVDRAMAAVAGDRGFQVVWRGKVPNRSIGPLLYRVGTDFCLS